MTGSTTGMSKPPAGRRQAPLAAQHRTDITFDEYLVVMANIALGAQNDSGAAQSLALSLSNAADVLRDTATDLAGDHNVTSAVTSELADLADSALRMKVQAQQAAEDCQTAAEAARIAAQGVARVYGQDMDAVRDAGLAHASAAAHHD
jgi:hypothetical protein